MKNKFSTIFTYIATISLLAPTLGYALYSWRNPHVNVDSKLTIYDSIYRWPHQETSFYSIRSHGTVRYVSNTTKEALNPYFPAIHITFDNKYNAWLHAVYTDAISPSLRQFVDASTDAFPWYSLQNDFYDAPHWQYGLFAKPLSFWNGHAYAVLVNHEHKTVKCVGGASWGFKLSHFRLRPIALEPQPLVTQDWQYDWHNLFAPVLKGYTQT